jgi:serine/threonine protein kinase
MGAIYAGKKIGPGGFEKEVVLKQLLPEFTSRPEFRDLFFREAKISATLDHQNIVRTFDLVNANDRLFIVMEYVRGADLRTIAWRARRRKPLSPQAILHVAMEILSGLAYAHTRRSPTGEPLRIIHRDLSPSNILCSGEGEVKLSDFGIAKAVTYSSVFYRVRGKVGYMSPEMARNQPLDARSDLFSLGVSIYETLIGERIYSGDLNTPADKIYAQTIPPLATKCPGLPPELQGVLDQALAIDPDERFANAESFSQALRQVALTHNLLYSAPDLAAELREIMGPDSENWLSDQRDPAHLRNSRAIQVPSTREDVDSLLAPGASISAGEDSDIKDVATPPARISGSVPAVRTGAPAPPPLPSRRSSESMAVPSTRPSAQASELASQNSAPATPAAPAQSALPVPILFTPTPADPTHEESKSAQPLLAPFNLPPVRLPKPGGGVAAIRRSRHQAWRLVLVILAVLLGFVLVRFVLSPRLSSLVLRPSTCLVSLPGTDASRFRHARRREDCLAAHRWFGGERDLNRQGRAHARLAFHVEGAARQGYPFFHAQKS